MKGNRFETIRWIFWPGILIVLAVAGCGTTTVAPTTLPTPPITPAVEIKIETPLPASTPTTPVSPTSDVPATTPVPPKSPTARPTFQYNIRILELTLTPIPTIRVDTNRTPTACPTPIFAWSIIHRDDNTGWRHYWASSSQQVSVKSLAIDGQWLWIATEEGLIRLDPVSLEYELFPSTGTSPDIALDHVFTLVVDDRGQLWAAGQHGLVRHSRSAGWKTIYTDGPVSSFALDADGNLWILSYSLRGLPYAYRFRGQEPPLIGTWRPKQVEWKDAYLDPANWRLLVLSNRPATEGSVKDTDGNTWSWSRNGYFLAIYYNGQLAHQVSMHYYGCSVAVIQTGMWIGAQEGLFYSDGHTLKSYRLTAGKAMMNNPRVDSLAFTADGSGWAITSEGLLHFSENVGEWEPTTGTSITIPLEEEIITLVASPQQNSLWAYSNDHLAHFDGQSWQRWSIPENLLYPWVQKTSVLEYQGALWFTNKDYDLWRFDGQTWSTIDAPEITNLAQDHHGRLYAADRSDSILVYDGTDWQPLPDCAECGRRYEFSEIAVDATGQVWGTYESGIWRYSTDEGWREILKFDTYTLVESPLTDAHGDFWFRSRGVVHCGLENCEFWHLSDDHRGSPITVLAADSQGRIWVGGHGLLSVYDPAAER